MFPHLSFTQIPFSQYERKNAHDADTTFSKNVINSWKIHEFQLNLIFYFQNNNYYLIVYIFAVVLCVSIYFTRELIRFFKVPTNVSNLPFKKTFTVHQYTETIFARFLTFSIEKYHQTEHWNEFAVSEEIISKNKRKK